jgi:O-succinylhomoserine sulfhydrylase
MGVLHNRDLEGLHPESLAVHGGSWRSQFGEASEAIFLTQGHVYESAEQCAARFANEEPGFLYARFSNPTVNSLERRIAMLEGGEEARATATGMAAVTAALQGVVKAGDHIVASRALFSSCRWVIENHLARFGVTSTFVDGTDLAAWDAAVRPNTTCFFLETPANPTLEVIDIEAVARLSKAAGAKLIIDNVFATPLYQRPLKLGADCVVYSATKHIDGQGRCLGGLIIGSKQFIDENIHQQLRHTGPAMSPFNAWVMLKGLETLHVRVARQTETAAKIADHFAGHARVAMLNYPGRKDHPQADIITRQMSGHSHLIAMEIKGGKAAAFRFMNALRLFLITNNLGDSRSLVAHPGTSTHRSMSQ